MDDITRVKYLPIAMKVIGATYVFAIYPMMSWIWPEGWGWTPSQHEYELILAGVFITLGAFLFIAAQNPASNVILIWLTITLNIVVGVIMLLLVLADETEQENLLGKIPVMFLTSGILWRLMPNHRFKKGWENTAL
ncbi:DUF6632 domain-containing protein [uncultured Microbulbifer sp.]|uniref:DUF6632 domain-containing protein n=1 Tax=uncultured Microbulbifer sp. TaxID=348147 RepID=UPI0026364F79|nr:DUF6632 domain-containing protein [uncultured Microbulbifer sp.]